MTAKRSFCYVKSLMDKRDSLKRQLDELSADLTAIGGFDYTKPMVQTSPKNVTEEKIIEFYEVFNAYTEAVRKCQEEIVEAESRLSKLSRPEYANVIRL